MENLFNNKMKGSKAMEIILYVFVFSVINIFFLWLYKKVEKQHCSYETAFCRDVRAELGMFAYILELEAKREKLNRKNSKF